MGRQVRSASGANGLRADRLVQWARAGYPFACGGTLIERTVEQMIRNLAIAGAAVIGLAACTAHEQRVGTGAGLGAGAGAIAGAAITGDVEGALLGAAAGAAAGAIIGHVTDRPGYCYARDSNGRTIIVQCPAGY